MSAPSGEVLRWGRERARAGLWRGEAQTAQLSPLPDSPPPSAEFVRRCLDTLASRGFDRVVTSALSPFEQAGFLAAGFDVEETLHLLSIDLSVPLPPVPPGLRLVTPRRGRWPEILAVDSAAFPPFWRFDHAGLSDALAATPRTRFKAAVTDSDRRVAGYAVCGRSGARGFVQRLAVDPGQQRAGTGRRLLIDGLQWMRRRGVRKAVVNTQHGNEPALALYRATGFTDEPNGLCVLSAGLS